MNKKIKKYLDEIAKTEKKIADLQQYLRGVQAALKQDDQPEGLETGGLEEVPDEEESEDEDFEENEK